MVGRYWRSRERVDRALRWRFRVGVDSFLREFSSRKRNSYSRVKFKMIVRFLGWLG